MWCLLRVEVTPGYILMKMEHGPALTDLSRRGSGNINVNLILLCVRWIEKPVKRHMNSLMIVKGKAVDLLKLGYNLCVCAYICVYMYIYNCTHVYHSKYCPVKHLLVQCMLMQLQK